MTHFITISVHFRGKPTLDFLETYEKQLIESSEAISNNFVWYDAFEQKSRLCKCLTRQTGDNTVEFELACIRWNIASLVAYLACENITETQNESILQTSCKDLQKAAGMFGALRSYVGKLRLDGLTHDLEDETLAALENYCLAAAQVAILVKFDEKMTKAKVAAGSSSLLDRVVDTEIPKSLRHDISVKSAYMQSLSEFYLSEVAKENAEHGQRIARLRKCVDLCRPISKVIFYERLRSLQMGHFIMDYFGHAEPAKVLKGNSLKDFPVADSLTV